MMRLWLARAAASHLSPLAGRGRIPSAAQAERRNPGEGAWPRVGACGKAPLTRLASLRKSSARKSTSPRKRGEVKRAARPRLLPRGRAICQSVEAKNLRERPVLTAAKNEQLTRVGAGTPMGELLRRYWQPVAGAS